MLSSSKLAVGTPLRYFSFLGVVLMCLTLGISTCSLLGYTNWAPLAGFSGPRKMREAMHTHQKVELK